MTAFSPEFSLRGNAASVYAEQRDAYLAQLVAPMDDMWAALSDRAARHALRVGEEVAVGDPRTFLEPYVRERLERGELLLFEPEGHLLCVGELRPDRQQEGIAQLGLIVHAAQRSRGLGSGMLSSLVTMSRGRGLSPVCSTELCNRAARRAIERAGFRATHRVLRVDFEL